MKPAPGSIVLGAMLPRLLRTLRRVFAPIMPRDDLNTRVFEELVSLAGSVAAVESVLQYLALSLSHPPSTKEIVDEILARRARAASARGVQEATT